MNACRLNNFSCAVFWNSFQALCIRPVFLMYKLLLDYSCWVESLARVYVICKECLLRELFPAELENPLSREHCQSWKGVCVAGSPEWRSPQTCETLLAIVWCKELAISGCSLWTRMAPSTAGSYLRNSLSANTKKPLVLYLFGGILLQVPSLYVCSPAAIWMPLLRESS